MENQHQPWQFLWSIKDWPCRTVVFHQASRAGGLFLQMMILWGWPWILYTTAEDEKFSWSNISFSHWLLNWHINVYIISFECPINTCKILQVLWAYSKSMLDCVGYRPINLQQNCCRGKTILDAKRPMEPCEIHMGRSPFLVVKMHCILTSKY